MRALIEGEEARLGSAVFCGLGDAAPQAVRDATLLHRLHACRPDAVIPIRQSLRPDAVAVTQALVARGLDLMVLSGDRPEAVASGGGTPWT